MNSDQRFAQLEHLAAVKPVLQDKFLAVIRALKWEVGEAVHLAESEGYPHWVHDNPVWRTTLYFLESPILEEIDVRRFIDFDNRAIDFVSMFGEACKSAIRRQVMIVFAWTTFVGENFDQDDLNSPGEHVIDPDVAILLRRMIEETDVFKEL